MSFKLITAPASEPVTLAEAKVQCKEDADFTVNDALIARLISGAREHAEHITARSLMTQTWDITLDAFPSAVKLTRPPLQSVTYVKYLDADGFLQTLDSSLYVFDNSDDDQGWIVPARGTDWPATYDEINAVTVRYVAGYASAAAVPAAIRDWILMLVGTMYKFRELDIDAAQALQRSPHLMALLDRYRIWSI